MWRGDIRRGRGRVWLKGEFTLPPASQHMQRVASSQPLDRGVDRAPLREIQLTLFERRRSAPLHRQQPAPATKLDHLDDIGETVSGCHSGLCHCATLALHRAGISRFTVWPGLDCSGVLLTGWRWSEIVWMGLRRIWIATGGATQTGPIARASALSDDSPRTYALSLKYSMLVAVCSLVYGLMCYHLVFGPIAGPLFLPTRGRGATDPARPAP